MRSADAHVFVDCGPVGLRGRGGHGHNDCLAFELWTDGAPLITDSGSFTYTSSYELRNAFRATAAHNTPVVDGEEQNRFPAPTLIWALTPDAEGELARFDDDGSRATFAGRHRGYARLADPAVVERTLELVRARRTLVVRDHVVADRPHHVAIRFHLAVGVVPTPAKNGWSLRRGDSVYELRASHGAEWTTEVEDGWFAPSYGVRMPRHVVVFAAARCSSPLAVEFGLCPAAARDPAVTVTAKSRTRGSS
jgi:uncharacterized heparinase superfamily protein